jgi:phenylalanyl-tRNA synthetase alpha subunit
MQHSNFINNETKCDDITAQKIDNIQSNVKDMINVELAQFKTNLEKAISTKLKYISQSVTHQEKKMDKIASSILHSVDQKFQREIEVKRKVTEKLEERMDGCCILYYMNPTEPPRHRGFAIAFLPTQRGRSSGDLCDTKCKRWLR